MFATNGGAPTHPDWYRNALAHPDVDAELGPAMRPYRARPAGHHERQRLWPSVTSRFARYAEYQAMTDREIPVLILEPHPTVTSGWRDDSCREFGRRRTDSSIDVRHGC